LLQHVKKTGQNVNIKQIKKILNEAIPSKSKWANDGRVGQEQLYGALEKVLIDLKNFTEHSLPFLKPVQKRDAPNYYTLIKNPMDLSTVRMTDVDEQKTQKLPL
jgi:transcriptional activator SPT7